MYELLEVMGSLSDYLGWVIVFLFGIWLGTAINLWNTRSILQEMRTLNLNISSYLRKQEQQTGSTIAIGKNGTGPIPPIDPVVESIDRDKNCLNCRYPVASTESICPSCQKPPFADIGTLWK